jgi:hypothetical protein
MVGNRLFWFDFRPEKHPERNKTLIHAISKAFYNQAFPGILSTKELSL